MNLSQEIAKRLERLVRKIPDTDLPTLVELLVLVANSDGVIDPDEHVALAAGIETVMTSRVAPAVVDVLVDECLEKLEAEGTDLRALAVGHVLAERNVAEDGLRVAIAVALASGGLAESALDLLGTIARASGVSGARLDRLIDSVREGLSLDA